MDSVEVVVRPYDKNLDDPFIYSTWTKNVYYGMPKPRPEPKKDWFQNKIADIREMLLTHKVMVACFKGDPYVIVGYMVAGPDRVKWLYIKEDYRNQGIDDLLTKPLKEIHEKRKQETRTEDFVERRENHEPPHLEIY